MKITVQCICNESFTLNPNFKGEPTPACPNCNRQLSDNMVKHFKELFSLEKNIIGDCCAGADSVSSYQITVSGFLANQ